MYETDYFEHESDPCASVFVETPDGGYVLTAEAQIYFDALDPPVLTLAERLVAVRSELTSLAHDLPAAARAMIPHDLLDAVEVLQQATNLIGSCDQAVVAEIDRQDVHVPSGATSAAQLLSDHLRIRSAEAKRRVVTARSCAERVGLDGQVLPPLREKVAAAQAAGAISTDQAGVIARALGGMPTGVPVDKLEQVEQALVQLAGKRHATDVAAAGRAARDRFEADNPEPRERKQYRQRSLNAFQRDDGMGSLRGDLTAPLLAKLLAVLTPLAAPRPFDANGDDTRSYTQRLHDALEDLLDRFLRSGTLPDCGGVPTTVAVTIPVSWLQEQTARVTTTLGVDLSARQFLHLAADTEIIPVVLNDAGGIMSHGRTKRFATPAQTKALRARDRGCTFPDCTRPPEWTQRHHVEEWVRDHGDTDIDIDTMALLCGYHHRGHESWGWSMTMKDGAPWWIPPTHLDPEQKPVQNTAHSSLAV